MRKIGTTFSAEEIIGKTLIAKRKVNVYTLPNPNSKKIGYVKEGGTCGVVYSYIQNSYGVWWMFNSGSQTYYILHGVGLFNVTALASQGAITLDAANEAEAMEQMNYFEKLGYKVKNWASSATSGIDDSLKKTLTYAGLGLLGFFIIKGELTKIGEGRFLRK